MGVGCSATRESTDSSVSRAHEDTQITEHTGHGAESSTKAETEEPILQTVIIQQVRDNSITVEHVVLLNSYLEEDLQTLKDLKPSHRRNINTDIIEKTPAKFTPTM